MVVVAFTSCVDDNADTEAPFLKVSPTNLVFTLDGKPAEGSQSTFDISTNRPWRAIVKDNKTWVTFSATEGEGSAIVEVSIPEGINDEASVEIQTFNKVGILKTETVTIKSCSVVAATLIYNETFGTTAPKGSPFLFVDAFNDWVKTGMGSSTVDYTGPAASIRQTERLSAGYKDASGADKLFFGANASFIINKITLAAGQTNLQLTFGGSYSQNTNGTYDNEFKQDKFHFYLMADEASVFSIDDPTLTTGNGGTAIDLAGGTSPEPGGEATPITILELLAKMTDAQTAVDNNADRYFEAIVQSDVIAGNDIMLFGNQVDPKTLGVTVGDKVKVNLHKGLAKTVNFQGVYEVTGGKEEKWATVTKIGTSAITPVTIAANQLTQYQGMTVTIKEATPKVTGVWTGNEGTQIFSAGGTDFTVFCKTGSVFENVPFSVTKGNITGLALVYKNNSQLVPRSLSDVQAFQSNAPLIVSTNPTSLSFASVGGSKEIDVNVINTNGNILTVSGLSGIFSATVNGNKITVTAKSNTGTTAVNQTLAISLSGGNSVNVVVYPLKIQPMVLSGKLIKRQAVELDSPTTVPI